MSAPHTGNSDRLRLRHVRPPAPLVFPVEEQMPETHRHLLKRTALFEVVCDGIGHRATVGSEQFVYWDPTDPKKCCAPDLFVRLGTPEIGFPCWKVWERGAPELVVEITSASDAADGPWEQKLERFRRLGAREIVRFDPEDEAQPVRIWDGADGDVVERDPTDPAFSRCDTLGAYFCVRDDPKIGQTLRVANDPEGRDLWPTPHEVRDQAESRVAQLEAELVKRRGT